MKYLHYLAVAAIFWLLMTPVTAPAADDVQQLRAQFASIVDGLNGNSFDKFNRAIARNDMIARIYGSRLIDQNVKRAFSADFAAAIQGMFVASFPPSSKEILGTLIDFQFEGDQGSAVVRYAASGYRFSYHVYELKRAGKDRLQIVDWIDYYRGNRFSAEAGAELVMAMPTRAATRNLLENKSLSDGEVFQVAELFKAVRDNKAPRFFQIMGDLDDDILKEATLLRLGLRFALQSGDEGRIENAVRRVLAARPDDALYSLRLNDYFIPVRRYEE
ncbi:MAG: hypothetical protein HKN64_08495, partial [Woeseiaceae bacterium]|nr:hypothetical protein [Woeseiaceae bacterium]